MEPLVWEVIWFFLLKMFRLRFISWPTCSISCQGQFTFFGPTLFVKDFETIDSSTSQNKLDDVGQ